MGLDANLWEGAGDGGGKPVLEALRAGVVRGQVVTLDLVPASYLTFLLFLAVQLTVLIPD